MKYFYVELFNGNMGIYKAKNQDLATKIACWNEGRNNVRLVREATEEELQWFQSYNGLITETE